MMAKARDLKITIKFGIAIKIIYFLIKKLAKGGIK